MRKARLFALIASFCAANLAAQGTRHLVEPLLQQKLQNPALVSDELRHFDLKHVPELPPANSVADFKMEADRLRAHELELIYHGWPREWVDAKPKFEQVAVIERTGYRIVKLRYEIVPGFESTALLYEPEHIAGKIPAILNVHGHDPDGKAAEYKQKRCINEARRGILALSLEWMNYGELTNEENIHNHIGLLDLTGAHGVGLFYLAMRRGLDYLYDDPRVDHSRLGMTGLSGGGWQTMLLSTLDTRVGPAAAVAGFSTLTTAIEHPEYAGDEEQSGPDMRAVADDAQLMTLRAPRPTLLIYNSMDDCCFRAGVVKQGVYLDILPYFDLMGATGKLTWHENENPGTHNYQIDNRQHAYQFFDSVFGLNASDKEDADTDSEVMSFQDLEAGVPKDNLTIVGLARQLAANIHHDLPADPDAAWAAKQRDILRGVVRFSPVTVTHAWPISATHEKTMESRGYRFEFSNGLSATGVFMESTVRQRSGGITLLIADAGKVAMIEEAGNDFDRGQRVLVMEPLFFGENVPGTTERPAIATNAQILNSVGERPLGLEAAQIVAVAQWLQKDLVSGSSTPGARIVLPTDSAAPVRVITSGRRSETTALVAAAIMPELFSSVEARDASETLGSLFTNPPNYDEAPELMCLDLYKDFDLNILGKVAAPVKISLLTKEAKSAPSQ